MDRRPELSQLQEYVQILNWQELAIALGCDQQKVDEIDKDNRKTVDARREMFKLYLKNPEATNAQVYDALRSRVVGEPHTAEKYRKLFVPDSVESLSSSNPQSSVRLRYPDIYTRIWIGGESGQDVVEACIRMINNTGIFPDDKKFMYRLAYTMSRYGKATWQLQTDGGIWQVSLHAFQDTKDVSAHKRLPSKYQSLFDSIGIKNWKDIKRSELEKPMYSAIAARLYLSNFAESIPPDYKFEEQEDYWWNLYMIDHESKCFMKKGNFLSSVREMEGYSPVNIGPSVETHHEKTWHPYFNERKVNFSRNETSEEDNAEVEAEPVSIMSRLGLAIVCLVVFLALLVGLDFSKSNVENTVFDIQIPHIETRIWTAGETGQEIVEACIRKLNETRVFADDKHFMRRLAFVMSADGDPSWELENDGGIWQVSRYAFTDTKAEDIHSQLLSKKHKALQNKLGIKDWKKTTRQDLEVPMYSAIAARLYISNYANPIPPRYAIAKQDQFWWQFYMKHHESANRIMKEGDFLSRVKILER